MTEPEHEQMDYYDDQIAKATRTPTAIVAPTLVEFLRTCLDEDQQKASNLMRLAQDTQLTLSDSKRFLGRDVPGWHEWPDVEQLCARTLAEIAARRAIIDEHRILSRKLDYATEKGLDRSVLGIRLNELCFVIKILAQPFADRPGWSEEWAVKG